MTRAAPEIVNEVVDCPLCSQSKINITMVSDYYSEGSAHSAGRSKMIPHYHPEKFIVQTSCPNCKATKADIKEALEKGKSKFKSHEERVQSFKDRGLPLVLESKKKE